MVSDNIVKALRAKERKNGRTDAAIQHARGFYESPRRNDVLTGRGKGCQDWSGNVEFRNMVDPLNLEYNAKKTNQAKHEMVERIYVHMTVTQNMRFLLQTKLDSGVMRWVRQPIKDALEKIRARLYGVYRKSVDNDPNAAKREVLPPTPSLVDLSLTPPSFQEVAPEAMGQGALISPQSQELPMLISSLSDNSDTSLADNPRLKKLTSSIHKHILQTFGR